VQYTSYVSCLDARYLLYSLPLTLILSPVGRGSDKRLSLMERK